MFDPPMRNQDSHTVLIVSGEQPTPGLSPGFLRHAGIRLITAPHDDGVFRLAREKRPSLIIEDCPVANGASLEFCLRLKSDAATGSIPLILVAPSDVAPISPAVRPDALVVKPIVQRAYYEAVSRFIALPRRRVLRHAVNLRFIYEMGETVGQAFTRDLSLHGAFLKTDRALSPGSHLDVQFAIPGQLEAIRCGAVVRRSEPFGLNSPRVSGFAIEFEGIAENDLERLEQFIERQLGRALFSF